jgi:hypothetical protein
VTEDELTQIKWPFEEKEGNGRVEEGKTEAR